MKLLRCHFRHFDGCAHKLREFESGDVSAAIRESLARPALGAGPAVGLTVAAFVAPGHAAAGFQPTGSRPGECERPDKIARQATVFRNRLG